MSITGKTPQAKVTVGMIPFRFQLASVHKYLRICDLCKELGIVVYARILQRSGPGKPRPTLVWCLRAR